MGQQYPWSSLRLQTPAILSTGSGYVVLSKANSKFLEIASPKEVEEIELDKLGEEFGETIEVLILERKDDTPTKKFGIAWFLPVLKKYRAVLVQVLLASFVVQLFGLANPLLIQVIIDKVISQRSLDTLQVLGFALIVVTVGGVFRKSKNILICGDNK